MRRTAGDLEPLIGEHSHQVSGWSPPALDAILPRTAGGRVRGATRGVGVAVAKRTQREHEQKCEKRRTPCGGRKAPGSLERHARGGGAPPEAAERRGRRLETTSTAVRGSASSLGRTFGAVENLFGNSHDELSNALPRSQGTSLSEIYACHYCEQTDGVRTTTTCRWDGSHRKHLRCCQMCNPIKCPWPWSYAKFRRRRARRSRKAAVRAVTHAHTRRPVDRSGAENLALKQLLFACLSRQGISMWRCVRRWCSAAPISRAGCGRLQL
jgi:hypothetical protein